MTQRKIIKRTLVQEVYVGNDGKETIVGEMADRHLLNALLVAEREDNGPVSTILFDEAIKRMQK